MVLVPAGKFLIGDPPHEMELDAFRIDRTEVTRGDYDKCVANGACVAIHDPLAGMMTNSKSMTPVIPVTPPDHPVVWVTRDEAAAYCAWRVKVLTTEAQWEKAARGVDGRKYPWGDTAPTCELALFENWSLEKTDTCGEEDSHATHAVGKHPKGASPYGALDMAGNVLEWTSDMEASFTIARGGRGFGNVDDVRITSRKLAERDTRDPLFGFAASATRAITPKAVEERRARHRRDPMTRRHAVRRTSAIACATQHREVHRRAT